MLQHLIGTAVGAIVTFVLLVLLVPETGDRNPAYLTSVVVGGICTILWPLVIGFWLARRAKARREDAIQSEVERQMAAQQRRPPG